MPDFGHKKTAKANGCGWPLIDVVVRQVLIVSAGFVKFGLKLTGDGFNVDGVAIVIHRVHVYVYFVA